MAENPSAQTGNGHERRARSRRGPLVLFRYSQKCKAFMLKSCMVERHALFPTRVFARSALSDTNSLQPLWQSGDYEPDVIGYLCHQLIEPTRFVAESSGQSIVGHYPLANFIAHQNDTTGRSR